jgi:hypothetical protein
MVMGRRKTKDEKRRRERIKISGNRKGEDDGEFNA